jgi:hypothetical protein
MKLKYLKYWKEIPLLYSIAFILDPRGKMRGLFNVLQIMQLKIDHDYTAYYADIKTEIYKLFNKYEEKFRSARTQRRATQPAGNTGKRKHAWGRIFEILEPLMLLDLHLPLLPIHPYQHLLLLVS